MSQSSFPTRDFRGDWPAMERVSTYSVALRVGVDERTVLAFVQDECVRDGAGGDSGEKREDSMG